MNPITVSAWSGPSRLDRQRLISREVIVHTEKGVEVDQFYAERLYTPELIRSLLEEAGFQEVSFHGSLTPDSARGQDLGMMERRILVSARIRKEWAPVKSRKKNVSTQVAVVMGDPSKPDPLKTIHGVSTTMISPPSIDSRVSLTSATNYS